MLFSSGECRRTNYSVLHRGLEDIHLYPSYIKHRVGGASGESSQGNVFINSQIQSACKLKVTGLLLDDDGGDDKRACVL
jgi:hypothetical protein